MHVPVEPSFFFAWNNTQYLCEKVPWPSSFQNGYRKKETSHSIHIYGIDHIKHIGGLSNNSIGDDFQQYTCKLKHLNTDPFRKRIPTHVALVSSSPTAALAATSFTASIREALENFLQMEHRLMRRAQHQTRLIASAQDVGSLKLTMEVGFLFSKQDWIIQGNYFPQIYLKKGLYTVFMFGMPWLKWSRLG